MGERTRVRVANWPGFATSMATEVLHKKSPALIPVLDNQAIVGAYMNPFWPERRSSQESVQDQFRIEQALDWMTTDLLREKNAPVWPQLRTVEQRRTLIQIFDSVWWMYFRNREPVRAAYA